MSPSIATVVYGFFILALLLLERNGNSRVSSSLWIPVVWLSISASRVVSQWLGSSNYETVEQVAEGSPLDALIFSGLLAAGLIVLIARRRRAWKFLRGNGPLLVLLAYCLISVLWSDYPFVAFKRWTKALGDLVMVLVVLTDLEPKTAIERFFSRSGFLLVPLSILLIKYFPSLGRGYSPWTGEAYNNGVATHKNGLGYVCLIFGLTSLWYILEALLRKNRPRASGPLIAHAANLAMVLWLFRMANSATSLTCFLVGGGLMAATSLPGLFRKTILVHVFVGMVLFLALYGLILNPGAGLAEAVGRDQTLTGRTALWHQVLGMTVNPVFGAGYESFWLGGRLEQMWQVNWEHPNQAHNGYLEVYLDLGWIGLALIGLVMAWGYRTVVRTLSWDPDVGRLKLAFFVIAVVYNLTEHGFRELHPVWIAFLLSVTVVPNAFAVEEPEIVALAPHEYCFEQPAAGVHACEEIT